MNVLGLDTATPTTTVALLATDGRLQEQHDDIAAGERPRHSQELLALAAALLERAALPWDALDLVAVGIGPGGYTGLRIGISSARGLARATGARLVGVGTLRALAQPVAGRAVAAVLDARRGETFVAVHRDGEELLRPTVCRPQELAGLLLALARPVLALGDGAVRYRQLLESASIEIPPDDSPHHRVSAAAICRIAASGGGGDATPDYLRLADAEIALGAVSA